MQLFTSFFRLTDKDQTKRSMKKTILLLSIAVAMLTSCISIQEVKSNKPIKSEKRPTAPFERVRLIGSPTVYYAQTDSASIRVEAPEDILEYVMTEIKDSCLTIKIDDQAKNIIKNLSFIQGDDVNIYVTSPDLVEVLLAGSGDIKSERHVDTDNLRIELKGSGDIYFADIICDHITTLLVGSGDINIDKVTAASSSLELVGSGDLKITHEGVARTDILLKGSGDIKSIMHRCGDVVSDLRGSGDITLSGDVRSIKQNMVGSGDYHTSELVVRE